MITAQTKIDLRLFEAPLSLIAKAGESTIFEGHSNFENGKFSPDLDKAMQSICNALGIEAFLKTEVKLTEVTAHYNWSENRLFVEGTIPLEHSTASLILNYQPSKDNPQERDFAVILDLQFNFDLADLPIVASDLEEQLRLTLAFANNDQTIEIINFGDGNEESLEKNKGRKITVQSGVSLKPNIEFPDQFFDVNYELVDFTPPTETTVDLENDIRNLPKLPEQKGTKWFDLNKNIGGLNFHKIGMRWHESKAWVLLNLDYMSSGLEFSLLGLQAGSAISLKTFRPKFDLHGIGIHFKNSFIEIGGSLLKVNKESDKTPTAYIGKMLMRLSSMSIGAIGGFTKTKTGENSFFAFANVGVPLGGIPAFFINGLSAGFGYNSELHLPSAAEVGNYPLLNIIKTGKKNPSDALAYLGNIVTSKKDAKWLAAGIQFTSFNLLDSNAILVYQFGKKECSILGVSRLILPSEQAAYLNLQFGLKATYQIQNGEIKSNAQLSDGSYLIHKGVQLDGSVAVYTWLKGENSGDFVLTIGGYHPRFNKPSHYPTVPKLGFSWIVSETTKIEGNTYFALTSQAIMAGFNFDATYQKGRLKAWFKASSDLILQWKPFYYDFHTKIRLGAKYQSRFIKNYKLDIGADLHLYGPEMGGYAKINWTIISFAIKFGNPDKSRFVYVLDWEMFNNNFLPLQEKEVCRVTVANGLLEETKDEKKSNEENNKWILNPDNLCFATQSLIPSNHLTINGQSIDISSDILGIRPMNKRYLESTQTITIYDKTSNQPVTTKFEYEVNKTNFSPALWSPNTLNRQQLKKEQLKSIAGLKYLMPVVTPNGHLAKAKSNVFETNEKTFLSKFDSTTETINTKIETNKNTISMISASINATETIENRTTIINDLNDYFGLANDERLSNDSLENIKQNAEQIFQSEPKTGQIQGVETQFAIPKMMLQSTKETVTEKTIQLPTVHFAMNTNNSDRNVIDLPNSITAKGLKPTAKDKEVIIKNGSAYIFELDENDTERLINFRSDVLTQVIEFNAYNHILTFHILPISTTQYKALPTTKRLALRSTLVSSYIVRNIGGVIEQQYDGWKSTDSMPLVNDNALLGDKVLVQLQVPMADESETHGTIKSLHQKNYIKTINGIQKGYIDTVVFSDYQEVILIVKQVGHKNRRTKNIENTIQISVPHTYRNNFTRRVKKQIKLLRPITSSVDKEGLTRIKYKISNRKIRKKSATDFDWNAFTLRVQTNDDWEVKEIRLFEEVVQKNIWME